MKAYEFANKVKTVVDVPVTAMSVFLSDEYYNNQYGHKVLPLKVHCYPSERDQQPIVVGFNKLYELCGKVPYLNTNKRLHKGFMIMRIDLEEQEFNGNKYYKTNVKYIYEDQKIVPKLESLKQKVAERIKEIRNAETPIDYFEDFDEL